jgi:hypothetical protein
LKNKNPFSSGNRKKTRNFIINNNSNFINSNIKRKSFHKTKNTSRNRINLTKNTSNNKINKTYKESKNILDNKSIGNLTPKEKSFLLLSNSPILRLKERILFGRSSQNLRKVQSISVILNKNQIFHFPYLNFIFPKLLFLESLFPFLFLAIKIYF